MPAVIVFLILCAAATRLLSGWSGYPFQLDNLLFAQRLHGVQFSMATASCFVFFSTAFLWNLFYPRSAVRAGIYLLLPAAFISLFSLLGFMLNEKDVRESLFLSPMSLVTTSMFILLLIPLLTLFRQNPLLKIFQSRMLGGLVARRFIPYLLLIPTMVFVFGIIGRQSGIFSYALSGSAQISLLFFALLFVLVKLASVIDGLDEGQKTMNKKLLENAAVLDQTNKDLQTFTYAASHDLQEPLRKISIYTGLIRDRPDHPQHQEYVAKIILAATRGTQLIHDILEYSRTTHHQGSFLPTDLGELLSEVISDFERTDQRQPPRIEPGPLPVIEAVPFQMRQLFSNLMSNSLKFLVKERAPVIVIRAGLLTAGEAVFPGYTPGKNYWKIEFEDNGEGFDEKYAGRIFEVFQRVSRNKVAGSGIGLSICKKIVTAHGGQITARPVPAGGASFSIILPERQH